MEKAIANMTANYLKAMSHPSRIKIIKILVEKDQYVKDIAAKLSIEQSNLSQHLNVLKKQGIVDSKSEGTSVLYWLKNPTTHKIITDVEDVLKEQITQSQALLKRF